MSYKVKDFRRSLKMTQEELSKKSGVSRGTISALENGLVHITTTRTLIKLADALETSVDQIFLPSASNLLNARGEETTTAK